MAVGFIDGRNRRKPWPVKSLTKFISVACIEYTSPWAGFELTTLVAIGTDCTGNCKSNYHTIMTTMPSPYMFGRCHTLWKISSSNCQQFKYQKNEQSPLIKHKKDHDVRKFLLHLILLFDHAIYILYVTNYNGRFGEHHFS